MTRYIISPKQTKSYIHPEVYGNFSEHLGRCIYEGLFVGNGSPIPNTNGMRNDVVEALKRIKLPVLRWPGGCFADTYHWADGIGPAETRKKIVNTHWGGVVEDNSFGTHEFMELCRQIGCKPYVNGNLGSGSVQEMAEWIEYMTDNGISPMADLRAKNGHPEPWSVQYFGVGNENWGCGGNMTPEFYADNYRRYQTYLINYGDNRLYKIACGPGTSVSEPNYQWTEVMMAKCAKYMDGYSLHYYTVPSDVWDDKPSATEFDEDMYYFTLQRALEIEGIIEGHSAIMDRYDPEKRIGLVVDEWGTWFAVEPGTNPGFLYQQNTMRDAMVAGLTLNIFNRHSDRISMANIAQTVNVLQSVILTEGEKMILTPTYHVFDLYKVHQGATLLSDLLETEPLERGVPDVSATSSMQSDGTINTTLCNPSCTESREITLTLLDKAVRFESGEILTGPMTAKNTFEQPDAVKPEPFTAEPVPNGADTVVTVTLPPCSVVRLTFA